MYAVAHLPLTVDTLVDAVLDRALRPPPPSGGDDVHTTLHALAREAHRLSVPLDSLVFALRDGWLRALDNSGSVDRLLGERFVRVAHACIREYLRADARAVVDRP